MAPSALRRSQSLQALSTSTPPSSGTKRAPNSKEEQDELRNIAKRQKSSVASLTALEEVTLDNINKFLRENRSQIMLCWGALSQGVHSDQVEAQAVADPADEVCFPNTYTNFKLLPKYWIASFLLSLKCGFSRVNVDKIDARTPEGLRSVLCYLTGIAPQTYWPPAAHNKEVLTAMLKKMITKMGNRCNGFVREHVPDDGAIDWASCGPYAFTWKTQGKQGIVETITHRSGKEASDIPLKLTSDFKLQSAFDDLRCQLIGKGAIKPLVMDLFLEGTLASVKSLLSKVSLVALADEIAAEILTKHEDDMVVGDDAVLTTAKEEAKAKAKAKAKGRAPPNKHLQVPLKITTWAASEVWFGTS